jgi:hypothetical protein
MREAPAIPDRFLRQRNVFDPTEKQETITIIGAGNIGSLVGWGVAKMGMKSILVYDFDSVEEHNLSSQFYSVEDVGKLKTECLRKHLKEFTGTEIMIDGKFINQPVFGVLILAVDSMEERKRIVESISKNPPKLIIDGRMGGNTIEVYCAKTPAEYQRSWTAHTESVPCSARYISYTSLLIAGIITDQVKRYLNGEELKPNVLLDADTFRIIS